MKESNIFEKLYNLYREQKFAHAYLIETNDVEKCYINVVNLSKKLFCPDTFEERCTKCNICNLIDKKTLPNLITIEPDGKSIKKGQIDELKKACSSMPLFVDKTIYIIKYAEKMNDTAYNKMLKFLEEPEENIIGFYITNSKDNMPSTIISRLEVIKDYYDIKSSSLLTIEQQNCIEKYIELLNKNDKNLIWYNETEILPLFKEKIDIINGFKYIFEYYHQEKNNYEKLKILTKYLEELNYNVNTKLLLDSFVLEMSDINGN